MNIILVESNLAVSSNIEHAIAAESDISVTTVTTEEDAMALTATGDYAMMVLGKTLHDSASVVRHFRQSPNEHHSKIPMIVITREYDPGECARILNVGADDYESVGDIPGIIARMHAVLRRSKGHRKAQLKFSSDTYFDYDDRALIKDGKTVPLTNKEADMLLCLLNHRGQTVNKDTLMQCLYQGTDQDVQSKSVDVFACKLRRKLREAGVTEFEIATDFGRGYRADMVVTPLGSSFRGSVCPLQERLRGSMQPSTSHGASPDKLTV